MIEKYLSKLGNMLQKRKRPSFKTDLRAVLLNKALELNEAPAKRGFAWPEWQSFFVKRAAPALAAVMIVVLAVQFLLPSGSLLPQLVNVAEAKDYYTLTPELEDETGVASESSFLLSSKGDLDVNEVETVLSVSPETELVFEQISDSEVTVTPVEILEPGEIYSFSLEAQNLSDSPYPKEYNWAYEVSDGFRVTGTLPGYQEAGVPTNTGIEIYFTHYGVTKADFEKAFSISPAVNGKFEMNGKTGIFAPSGGLKERTIYTVSIEGGLGLPDSDRSLGEDYVFQFETESSTRGVTTLNFTKQIYEFNPDEAPRMQVTYYGEGDEDRTVQASVYSYDSGSAYLAAMQKYRSEAPMWSYYQRRFLAPSSSGLEKIMEMPEVTLLDDNGNWLQLEDSLPSGYYLIEVTKNDVKGTAFLQVSSTAVYLNLNEEAPLVWVNSTETGSPIKNAEVAVVGSEIKEQSNGDGVASFNNLYEELEVKRGEDSSLFFEVTVDGRSTYYEAPLYLYAVQSNELYWQFLQTERSTYQPTDTVHYWGFVQGREDTIEQDAELYLVEGYFWGYEMLDALQDRVLIEKQKITLKDGEAFEGSLDIKNLSTNAYHILIVQNGQLLTNTSFYVKNYVKPAYDLSLSSEKTVLFEGETATATLHAAFFEGTPVPHTEFRATLPTGEEKTVTTDVNGDAQISWTTENFLCTDESGACSGSYSDYLHVSPVQEEMGEIVETLQFRTFNSTVVMDDFNSTMNNEKIEFTVYDVDLASTEDENFFGEPAAGSRATVVITQVDHVQREVGEYYDATDKVVRKKYEYDRVETFLKEASLTPNKQGEYSYEPGLSEAYDYEVKVKVYDAEGNRYDENSYISNGHNYYGFSNYISIETTEYELQLGEEATVTLSGIEPGETWKGSFLFMENQNGVQKYSLETEPSYTLSFGKEHIPNVGVGAVQFDGKYYRASGELNLTLNTDDRRMDVEISTDKDRYEPGEEVTLQVNTGEKARVNLYLVDEAYYALFSETFRDPLELVYSSVDTGVNYTYLSHLESQSDADGGKGGCFVAGTLILMADGSSKPIEEIVTGDKVLTRSSEWDATLTEVTVKNTIEHTVNEYLLVNGHLGVTEEHVLFINGQWQLAKDLKVGDYMVNKDGEKVLVDSIAHVRNTVKVYNFETEDKHTYFADGLYVHNEKGDAREDFRDTALFEVVSTDAKGFAEVKFTLPDNITSWRISAAGVSGGNEIHAGYSSANIEVSKPLFVNPVINSTYLTGDQPSLPVRAYGDSLKAGAAVTFSMTLDENDLGETAGTAFETSYFDLPVLESGLHSISTSAEAGSHDDTVILPVNVVSSHLSQSAVSSTLLSNGISLEGSDTERTEVHFLNNEVGTLYSTLLGAYYGKGDRADEAVARTLAAQWLNSTFAKDFRVPEYSAGVYQDTDVSGGIALLPYADADLELSAKMAALAPDHVNKSELVNYFEEVLNSTERTLNEKILALYGLAGLGESYLTELTYFTKNFDLEDEDKLYAALAFSEYGDDDKATELFLEIYEEKDAEWNALLSALAEAIGSDLSDSLWSSALEKEGEIILLEKMLFVKARLENGAQKTVSFKLNGEKIELKGSTVHVRSFLPEDLAEIEISGVDGEVAAVSYFETPINLDTLETSDAVTVSRSYWVDGKEVSTFATGDIVEVHLKVTSNVKDAFTVSDYLPSGMQTVTGSNPAPHVDEDVKYRPPYNQDGQTLRFYLYCDDACKYGKEFYYLARVINPGLFVLEPATVQSLEELETINISGKRGSLTIE